ncbi:hypothetical protein Hanom_Chr14g01280531 [Helianthus anomalus]
MVFLLLRSDGGSDGRQDDGVSFVEKWWRRQRLGLCDVFWYSSGQTQVRFNSIVRFNIPSCFSTFLNLYY